MIKSICVPLDKDQRYYYSHYRFFYELALDAGVNIYPYDSSRDGRGFEIKFKDMKALIDFGDHLSLAEDIDSFDIAFKYHYSKERHSAAQRLYPLTPISFYDWDEYRKLEKNITYRCNANTVLNNQKPGAAAERRRLEVQALLCRAYGRHADIRITSRRLFWYKINHCLVSVCVPGARDNILDRGQFQYMAFGACTISPKLDITLPFWEEPKPDIHYIECKTDYSNLIEKIEECRKDRNRCIELGRQAKNLFLKTSIPERIWSWINECVEKESK